MSFLSKLTERVIADRLLPHLSSHNLLSNFQSSAFRKFHSCETAILRVQNDIFVSLDAGRSTAFLHLDLSVTLNTINHHILLHCLKHSFSVHQLLLICNLHSSQVDLKLLLLQMSNHSPIYKNMASHKVATC